VCGGIAEYFNVDPVFVRIAMIVPLFLGVPTPLIYAVCWAVLPKRGGLPEAAPGVIDVTPVEPRPRNDGTLIAGLVILLTGVLLLCLNLGILDWGIFRWWRWRYLWPSMLIGAGVLILARSLGPGLRRHDSGSH
jgi:phage shock protein C